MPHTETLPSNPLPRTRGVVIACQRDDGKWLCIRRSQFVAAPFKVCFPGGMIEPGESQQQAVIREMREELAAEVAPLQCVWEWFWTQRQVSLWGWKCQLLSSKLTPEPKEVAEILWLTGEEVSNHPDGLPSNRLFVASLAAKTVP